MAQAQGIDVSRYQGNVDWNAVKAAGYSFAFAKATEGTSWVDPKLAQNWQGMKAAGIVRGVYHFYRGAQDARAQAEHLVRNVTHQPGDLAPVLDLELTDNASNAALVAGAETWLTIVEQSTGRKPIIYTRANFWNTYVKNAAGQVPSWSGEHGLWIAHYTPNPQPTIPKGWSTWNFWQYTDQGTVPGISGNVDLNRFNGTETDLRAYVGMAPAAPVDADPYAGGAVIVRSGDPGFGEGWYVPDGDPEHVLYSFDDSHGWDTKYKNATTADAYYCVYIPPLPGAGRYTVEVFIPDAHATARAVGYHVAIYRPDGTQDEQIVVVDQSAHKNRWVALGTFDVDPALGDGGAGRVTVTDLRLQGTGPLGETAFGAVRWRPA